MTTHCSGPSRSAVTFSVVDPAGLELGEHPIWDPVNGRIGWVDVFGGVLRWVGPGGLDRWNFPAPLGAVALRRGGGVVAAAGDGVHFRDSSGRIDRGPIEAILPVGVRFNDAACDPEGNFLCGSVARDGRSGAGSLYRVRPDGEVEVLATSVTESNGLAWSHDGRVMYYVDSGEPVVRRYAYRAGSPLRRLADLHAVHEQTGVPDGICIDAEDCVWVALWEGSALLRLSAAGELIRTLELPVSRPTCPTFGGASLDRLFVSTAWEGLDQSARAAEPWCGHLLVCEPGSAGADAYTFGG